MVDSTLDDIFNDEHLLAKLSAMSTEELDALPFGVIKLDPSRRVCFYSATEARESGYGRRSILGLRYFKEVAPCMDTDDFLGRVERQLSAGTLDIEIGHTGDYSASDRYIRCRLISTPDGCIWIAHNRVR